MGETKSNGVTIRYDDRGAGEPALLCMPGWCASRTAFAPLIDLLAGRRRVLALDWRGHGASDPAPGDFGADALTADALAVIAASGAERVVPVATAHGGWEAIDLYRRLGPTRIPKIVLVDWIVTPAPPQFLGGLVALQQRETFAAARDRLFAMWTHGVEHPGVLDFVRRDMGGYGFEMWARGAREIVSSYARAGSPLDELARLDPPPATIHVCALPLGPGDLAAQQSFAAAHPWFQVHKLDARSHFPTIEVPDQVAAAIDRFLD